MLAALVILSTNTFSPVSNGDGSDTTAVQAKKEAHQLPNLLDQQIAVLMGLDINPSWTRERSAVDSLIYGIVKPDSTASAGIDEDYSCLITNNYDKGISLFFKTDKKKVAVKYASRGRKLHIKTVPLSQLVEQLYRTKKQCQQVDKYASTLRMEQLIGHRKLGL